MDGQRTSAREALHSGLGVPCARLTDAVAGTPVEGRHGPNIPWPVCDRRRTANSDAYLREPCGSMQYAANTYHMPPRATVIASPFTAPAASLLRNAITYATSVSYTHLTLPTIYSV